MNERRISYNSLWKLLVDKDMSQAEFRKMTDISFNTMTKLKNREKVSMEILLRICDCLDCDIGDICSYIRP